MTIYDNLIIGAGPVGLFQIFQSGILRLKTHTIDILPHIGGQCSALYPQKPIYDIPAFPKIMGGELIANLQAQIAPFNPEFTLKTRAESFIRGDDGVFTIHCNDALSFQTRTIILAAGAGAFGHNKPPINNIDEFEGKSVHYYITNKEHFRGRRVVIGGGGDSAVDWAIELSQIAQSVALVHRRAEFRATPESVEQLHQLVSLGKITLHIPQQPVGIIGQNGQMEQLILQDMDGAKQTIMADDFLPFYGLLNNMGPLKQWGLNLSPRGMILVNPASMMTNIEGIFAIGDCASYAGKLKLILQGFAEAAVAAQGVYNYIHGKIPHFEHSTSSPIHQGQ